MMRSVQIAILLLLAGCGHDTDRANPLDPQLTPGVALSVAVDDTAGVARLTWSRFDGTTDFGRYLVLRQVFDRVSIDTLGHVDSIGQTSWLDSTLAPDTPYLYRIDVVNRAGLAVPSTAVRAGPLRLQAVSIDSLQLNALTASATLRWSEHTGSGFVAYRVRRTAGSDTRVLAEIPDRSTTTYIDAGLRGTVDYSWFIDVLTETGFELTGVAASGSFHQVLGAWPIDTQARGAATDYVRLVSRDSGVEALLIEPESGVLISYDNQGTLLSRLSAWSNPTGHEESRGHASARGPDGTLYVGSIDQFKQRHRVFRIDPAGRLVAHVARLAFEIPEEVEPTLRQVKGYLELRTSVGGLSVFDSVRVRTGDRLVVEEGFSLFPECCQVGDEAIEGWHFQGPFGQTNGWLWLWGDQNNHVVASRSFEGSERVEVEAGTSSILPTWLVVGGDAGTRASLMVRLSPQNQAPGMDFGRAMLLWETTADGGGQTRRDSVFAEYPFLEDTRLRLRLSVTDGVPQAEVHAVDPWVRGFHQDPMNWTSVAAVADRFAFTAGPLAFSFDDQGNWREQTAFDSDVSETRSWLHPGETRPRVGVCLPLEDRLLWGVAFSAERWRSGVRNPIGPRLPGGGDVPLYHPLSFDVAPDGRLYILDAGNARVVVLDAEGNFLTQFGMPGSGPGQFDFGSGLVTAGGLDYAGALAVDDDGFIYVADVGNRRIQKFAP